MHGSVHYQLSGDTPNVTSITGTAGKNDGAINTYCGTIETSRWSTCANCHAGYGQRPQSDSSTGQLNNIDCLMCHQDDYARTPAAPFEDVPAIAEDGSTPRTIQVPVEDAFGFSFMPDESEMSITALEAARTVHATTRTSCLRCHANASESDGGKRGDISSVTANPPLSSDVHMSPQGQDFTCADCHDAGNHQVYGRGLDLRPNDVDQSYSCENCHPSQPHSDARTNAHTAHVSCQACHISTFAKDVSTEMARDWRTPVYRDTALNGEGGWKPAETRSSNVIPTYQWFDGTSQVYILGQVPTLNSSGQYALGVPLGDVTSADAKLFPMKEHLSVSAMHDATGQIIPHSTFTYYTTGSFDQAITDGMAQAGLTGSYTIVDVHTYQTINHGVEPAADALVCGECHDELGTGSPRLDLQDLGYGYSCGGCHGNRSSDGFLANHATHVDVEGLDCSNCHNFSRPERGLTMP
jgi:hypothetical protein